jgi:hypothetical protein
VRISELIADLLRIQAENGDLVVQAYSYGDISNMPVAEPTVHQDRVGPSYVLVEP